MVLFKLLKDKWNQAWVYIVDEETLSGTLMHPTTRRKRQKDLLFILMILSTGQSASFLMPNSDICLNILKLN